MNDNLLDVQNLSVEFSSKDDSFVAVNNISFGIGKGKTLSLVGESGSGKSVTALSVLQLLPEGSAGHNQDSSIKFDGKEINHITLNFKEIDGEKQETELENFVDERTLKNKLDLKYIKTETQEK